MYEVMAGDSGECVATVYTGIVWVYVVTVTMTALREQNPEKRDMLFLYKVTGQSRQQLTACMIPAHQKINIK